MTLRYATDDQRAQAHANCAELKQPLTLVPDRADFCAELLESQATIFARLNGDPMRKRLGV